MPPRDRAPSAPRAAAPRAPASTPGLAVRRFAVAILDDVLDGGRPLDRVLDHRASMPEYRALSPADRALVRAIVGTTLRRLGLVDDAIRGRMERALPKKANRARTILRIGAAQILFMEIPDHAAVSLSTELAERDRDARPWKALVNGVLRTIARSRDEILAGLDADRLATPLWLWRSWSENWGEDTARAFGRAHLVEPPLDLSVAADPALWAEKLGGVVLPTGTVRLLGQGRVDRMEGFTEGAWWVQDAAAALPARLLGDVAGLRVADLCAAPGGKTIQLSLAGAKVTAVDVSPHRLERLKQNLARLRLSNVETIAADLTDWRPAEPFDAILLDAPCSATGTIRRNPDVGRLKKAGDVDDLARLQADLLARVADWVKPGGLVVYCTCSLEKAEGEEQIARFLASGAPFERVPIDPSEIGGLAAAVTAEGEMRTTPDMLPAEDPRLSGLDGFFAVRLRRSGPRPPSN